MMVHVIFTKATLDPDSGALHVFPNSDSLGCTLFGRWSAVGSTASAWGGGVPVSQPCLGGVSVCLGHV